jgi:thymidylate synthase ThyX
MLLLRMRAHQLPEARDYAQLMLEELRKVIPSFLTRVDLADRGGMWSQYMEDNHENTVGVAARLMAGGVGHLPEDDLAPVSNVKLIDFDPDGEDKLVTAILYEVTDYAEDRLRTRVDRMSADEKASVVHAYVGERRNRRHKPGRAFERIDYRFDVLTDYGAFRDLQRHRLLTVDWQPLSPTHGFVLPEAVVAADQAEVFESAMERSAELYDALADRFIDQAPYAVSLAYRMRYTMQMNAREAMHLIELRSSPQGHPEYRMVAQEMHRLIRDQAGHRLVADAMKFVDFSETDLERLEAERRAEQKRLARN